MEVEVKGARIFVRREGSGPPVMLIHGNPDTSELWRPVMDRVKDSVAAIAPDLPGFGRSGVPEGFDGTLPAMAEYVAGVADGLEIDRPLHLAVHDFGGPFGLAFAVCHPERVASITVTNTLFHADYSWHFWARVWRTPLLGEIALALMKWPLFLPEVRRGSQKLTRAQIRAMFDRITPAAKEMILTLYRASDPPRFADWERKMIALADSIPVQVLWGEHDPYIPARFADRFGTADITHLPGCGHWVPAEDPEIVAEKLKEMVLRAEA